MKVLGILKSKFSKNDVINLQGKFYPYKNACILTFLKYFNTENEVETIFENNLPINKILDYLNKFDLCIIFSLKNEKIIAIKPLLKTNFLILESPFIFREVHKPLKNQFYIRVMLNNHLGQKFIKKYTTGIIRNNFHYIELKDRKQEGEHYLIINQMENDSAVIPINPYDWVKEIVKKIRLKTNRKIIIREHPLQLKIDPERLKKVILINRFNNCFVSQNYNLFDDLKNACSCLTFSSGSIVESIIANVPAYAEDDRSCGFEIASQSLNFTKKLNEPDKLNFLSALSNTHWNLKEISNGLCWNYFKNHFNLKN